ncbi:hypothetical protein WS70_15445 [Burkholderia mayonis]|uniref:Uncharacterized protein n=1 Tax=Burkholderia mayonis TaxID=1385591 RepID=A0A1B4FH71_9BURK|nr:hypothetical protein WS70_15445 [Burkholderia mayonis]
MRIAFFHAFVGDSPIIAASSGDGRLAGLRRVRRECSARAADRWIGGSVDRAEATNRGTAGSATDGWRMTGGKRQATGDCARRVGEPSPTERERLRL